MAILDRLRRGVASSFIRTYGTLDVAAGLVAPAVADMKREGAGLGALELEVRAAFPAEDQAVSSAIDGYRRFAETGISPIDAYYALRRLYWVTQGRANDFLGAHVTKTFPGQRIPKRLCSLLGDFTSKNVEEIASNIASLGYHRFGQTVPIKAIDSINDALDDALRRGRPEEITVESVARTFFKEDLLLGIPEVTRLATDPVFYHIASLHLRTQPVLGYINSWVSRTHDNTEGLLEKSAQRFHFDMSNPYFIKTFIYLTDVDAKTGPHCVVPGTHTQKPAALWRDGRIDDEEMNGFYPRAGWAVLPGKAGAVLMVDTRAFHKGMALEEGERRILELYYVNSLFGEHGPATFAAGRFDVNAFGDIAAYSSRFLSRLARAV
jgi:hypothetical protein